MQKYGFRSEARYVSLKTLEMVRFSFSPVSCSTFCGRHPFLESVLKHSYPSFSTPVINVAIASAFFADDVFLKMFILGGSEYACRLLRFAVAAHVCSAVEDSVRQPLVARIPARDEVPLLALRQTGASGCWRARLGRQDRLGLAGGLDVR